MTDTSLTSSDVLFSSTDVLLFDRARLSQRHSTWTVAGAGAITLGVLIGSLIVDHRSNVPAPISVAAVDPGTARLTAAFHTPAAKPLPALADPEVARPAEAQSLAPAPATIVPPKTETAMLAPGFVRAPAPAALADASPLEPRFVPPASPQAEAATSATSPVEAPAPAPEIAMIAPLPVEEPHDVAPAPVAPSPPPAAVAPTPSAPVAAAPQAPVAMAAAPQIEVPQAVAPQVEKPQIEAPQPGAVPLPQPRPAFRWAAPEQYRASRRQVARNTDVAPTPATPVVPADNRSFLEKFFGMPKTQNGPTLAYASPEDGLFGRSAAIPPVSSSAAAGPYTAVYDISAHTVTLPDGTKLEAHSGLGKMLDDPRHVNARNIGPTPPHVYDLTLRESLFHGVQALRLNPVGGGGVYGRTGLLAHTFMLGPNGDSNGCVSFRNYEAFLRAYQSGQVKRLVVVTGQG
jgi:hypothetical protein